MTALRVRSPRDFWAGVVFIAIGGWFAITALSYDVGTASRMGPAYFPLVLAIVLVLLGALVLGQALRSDGPPVDKFAVRAMLLVLGATILFGILVRQAGLLVALPLLVVISAAASIYFRWQVALIMAAGLLVFCYFVFIRGLGLTIPVWRFGTF
jgi:putative tricarboxylic transport membrane protein